MYTKLYVRWVNLLIDETKLSSTQWECKTTYVRYSLTDNAVPHPRCARGGEEGAMTGATDSATAGGPRPHLSYILILNEC